MLDNVKIIENNKDELFLWDEGYFESSISESDKTKVNNILAQISNLNNTKFYSIIKENVRLDKQKLYTEADVKAICEHLIYSYKTFMVLCIAEEQKYLTVSKDVADILYDHNFDIYKQTLANIPDAIGDKSIDTDTITITKKDFTQLIDQVLNLGIDFAKNNQ